jgi:hypothetical protein
MKSASYGLAPALPANIRQGWKGWPVINTPAYCEHLQMADVKRFPTLHPGACTIKLFTDVIYGFLQ